MVEYVAHSNIGAREVNEDYKSVAIGKEGSIYVVADGLGGHGGGEIASRIAVETICDYYLEYGFDSYFFNRAIAKAQTNLLEEQKRINNISGLKTTIVILVYAKGKFYMAHVGDTRGYYFKNNKMVMRTLDQSVPQMLVNVGEISESEIRNHPDRNRVLSVLGDSRSYPDIVVEKPIKAKKKNSFILCTDGFWELIEDSQMEETLVESNDCEAWISNMESIVVKNGEGTNMDNYTCIVVNMEKTGFFG